MAVMATVGALVSIVALAPGLTSSRSRIPGLTIAPARTHGIAIRGASFGPIALRNDTAQSFAVRVFPVLLAQDRQGGLLARDDPRSVHAARRHLSAPGKRTVLRPGGRLTRIATLRKPSRRHNFYGGLLFKGIPQRSGSSPQIVTIYQLNEALLLKPPPRLQRIRLRSAGIRAETIGGKRKKLRVLLSLANVGNTDVVPRGRLRVHDAKGRLVVVRPLSRIDIIPGATVDLTALITKQLPAGEYGLSAEVRAGRQRLRVHGQMRLFDVNQVETRAAKLSEFKAPTAYRGEPVKIQAKFRNTGNVPYAPRAQVSVQQVAPRQGRAGSPATLEVSRTAPGDEGGISGSVGLPASTGAYELTVSILEGDRVLDSRAVTVTPVAKPGILARIRDWITRHVIAIVGVMLGAILSLIAALIYKSAPPPRAQ
jgi:hypothetical protein